MCSPRQILPVYLADVVDGPLTVNWSHPLDDDDATEAWAKTAGRIVAALGQGRPVHVVGLQTFGTDPAAPIGYLTVAIDEASTGRIMDECLVTTEDTTEVRVKLQSAQGVVLTIDGAGALASEAVLQLLVEIEGDCQ